jgi:hypothetical protein
MLTPEDQRRIEAEEAYRAQLRRKAYTTPAAVGAALAVVAMGGYWLGSEKSQSVKDKTSAEPLKHSPQAKVPPNRVVDKLIEDSSRAQQKANIEHFKELSKHLPGEEVASTQQPPSSETMRFNERSREIASGQITVRSRSFVTYKINVTKNMYSTVLMGRFRASGGSGNDINAAVLSEEDLPNWINGHSSEVLWDTQGKKTTGTFKVALREGTYYIYIGNQFSEFSDKQVFLDAALQWREFQP